MVEEEQRIDPNTASVEDLRRLPGVGQALARRIADARPFASLDDMRRVPGLGEAVLARLAPHLQLPVGLEPLAPAIETETAETASEATPEPAATAAAFPSQSAPARGTEQPSGTFSRSETLWLAFGASALSLLLSVILTLAILAGINGTLNIARHREVRQLASDLAVVQRDMEDVSARLQTVNGRLESLEGLSGRMTEVEAQVDGLQSEIDQAITQVEAMQTSIDELSEQTDAMAERVNRFDTFLTGLSELLGSLIPAAEPSPSTVP
jgi:uncharacterized protein YoxC